MPNPPNPPTPPTPPNPPGPIGGPGSGSGGTPPPSETTPPSGGPPPSTSGAMRIYTLGKPDDAGNIDFTNCDGLAYRAQWGQCEPREGQYVWGQPDLALNKARDAGKLISMSVTAGARTPAWVYDAGAASWTYEGGGTGPQGTYQMPVPWDRKYLECFKRFLQAFAYRYGEVITHTNVAGINCDTQEVLLPEAIHEGYPRDLNERLKDVWIELLDIYAATFTKPCYGMHGMYFLPEPDVTEELIEMAIKHGHLYSLQWNGWGRKPMWDVVKANVGKVSIGLQEGSALGSQAEYDKAMNEAHEVGAEFCEIYPDDQKYAG